MGIVYPAPTPDDYSSPQDVTEYQTDEATGGVLIPLGSRKYSGMLAIIDAADVPLVTRHRWTVHKDKRSRTFYAQRVERKNGKQRHIFMHRMILGLTDRKVYTDHENHNGLDNRRTNIRIATAQQNAFNKRAATHGLSQYKGVSWSKSHSKWQVTFTYNRKLRWVGSFDKEIDAATAYDNAVSAYHQQFANPNFPTESLTLNFPDQTEREAA